MHHTKLKGDVGESYVIYDLTKKGYHVCVPLTEHSPYDLIATKEGKVHRIQIKYRSLDGGAFKFNLYNTWGNTSKGSVTGKRYNIEEIDYFAITNCEYVAYIPYTEQTSNGNAHSLMIRVDKPKNNQRKRIRHIDQYQDLN